MSQVIVSILSNHSVPNFLFLKEMEGKYDECLFITTPETDRSGREDQLVRALGAPAGGARHISVDGNDYQAILGRLKTACPLRGTDQYIVNLTGGTKMMSLAVHDYFEPSGAEFYYVPIGKNKYYNLKTGVWTPLQYRVGLHEYFTLYGIKVKCSAEEAFVYPETETRALFERVAKNRFHLLPKLLNAQQAETPELRRYYGGEWFEQLSYFKLKEAFRLRGQDIATSLKIYREGDDQANDNELDVAFVYENALHVVECKVTMHGWGREEREVVEEYLYKLAAISKDFGLQVKSYLFTLHRMSRFSEGERHALWKRCRILGIEGIVGGKMFKNLKSSLYNRQALENM